MSLTQQQDEAFTKAKKAQKDLMRSLYELRNAFYVNNSIPKNGEGVWLHIPRAQTMLEEIKELIDRAEEVATR